MMAKAKKGGGDGLLKLFLDKGDKLLLGIGGVVGVVFLALGLMATSGSDQDPDAYAKEINNKIMTLRSQMQSDNVTIDPLKGAIVEQVKLPEIAGGLPATQPFDPTLPPDSRRRNPPVLSLVEAQANLAWLKLVAPDIIFTPGQNPKVAVVKLQKNEKPASKKAEDAIKNLFNGKPPPRRPQPPQFPGGFPGGPEGGGPGIGGPGFPGGPGMGSGSGPGIGGPGRGSGSGPGVPGAPPTPGGPGFGMPEGEGGLGFGGSGADAGYDSGQRYGVEYVEVKSADDLKQILSTSKLAVTIKPQRMAILQASFPYAEQLREFAKHLRYAKPEDLYTRPYDMPVFAGIDLERRTKRGTQVVSDWTNIDYKENSRFLRFGIAPAALENDYYYVVIQPSLTTPSLPQQVSGTYPKCQLSTIADAIKKQQEQYNRTRKPTDNGPPESWFKDSSEDPSFGNLGGGIPSDAFNYGQGEGSFQLPSSPMGPGVGMPGGQEGSGSGVTMTNVTPPSHLYIRVFDNTIEEGYKYEYRMRVRLKNPNFGRKDDVSITSHALMKELPPADWFELKDVISVPQSSYMYVMNEKTSNPLPLSAEEKKEPQKVTDLKEGQALLQFHRWYDHIKLNSGTLTEPVGDWVIGELVAERGKYVYGKSFTPLPLWSSIYTTFELRPPPEGATRPVRKKDEKDPERRGVFFEPVAPRRILAVDISGGKVSQYLKPVGSGFSKTMTDTSASEVLLLIDGQLVLQTAAVDAADDVRKEREKAWHDWVNQVNIATQKLNQSADPMGGKPGIFD
ncbi:MAG: hypothetical protein R3B84_11850 [Zavarzinella sp.]